MTGLRQAADKAIDRITFYVMGHVDRRLTAIEARADQLEASLADTDRAASDALSLAREHAHRRSNP